MSPKSRNLAGDGCGAAAAAMKMKKKEKKKSKLLEKKPKKMKLKLSELERTKSLYICSLEYHEGMSVVSYVIRSIKLSRLLTPPSSSDDDDGVLRLQQVGYKAGADLPGAVGCGVLGSQVVFVGGVTPVQDIGRPNAVLRKDVYLFETKTKHEEIKKMDNVTLLGGKIDPLIVEVGGQLYSLCYTGLEDPPAFEVFDPNQHTCSALPQPPFFQRYSRYDLGNTAAYAIAGTKVFVSGDNCPVFCFDVSNPDSDWRQVPTMCEGGSFPFINTALVLDLPGGGNNKKIVFGYNVMDHPKRLGVFVMSGLDGNEESMRQIGCLKLPEYPYELGEPAGSDLVHIGGNKACLVITQFISMEEEYQRGWKKPGSHKTQGVAIPFEFEVDITKLDKKQCLTLQFMPPRVFQYHTNPTRPLFQTLIQLDELVALSCNE